MMNRLLNVVCVLFLFAGGACQNDELPFFDETKYVYIPKVNDAGLINYSFLYSQGRDREEILVPVKYTGKMLEEDLEFQVEVVKDKTTALAAEYDVKGTYVFRAGRFVDTMRIRLSIAPV